MSARARRHFAKKPSGSDSEQEDKDQESNHSESDTPISAPRPESEPKNAAESEATRAESSSESEAESDSEGSELESDSASDSGNESESESDSAPLRPKFVRKSKQEARAPADLKESTLELIERTVRAKAQLEHSVDDTDGLDPKAEYLAWQKRSEARAQRELDRLAAQERDYEERELARELESKRPKLN